MEQDCGTWHEKGFLLGQFCKAVRRNVYVAGRILSLIRAAILCTNRRESFADSRLFDVRKRLAFPGFLYYYGFNRNYVESGSFETVWRFTVKEMKPKKGL